MPFDSFPLFQGKLHAFPIIKTRRIFIGKRNAEGLVGTAFGIGNMHLELYSIHSGIGQCVDIAVQNTQASIVSLCDFCDYFSTIVQYFQIVKRKRKLLLLVMQFILGAGKHLPARFSR